MPVYLTQNCPHCGAASAAFTGVASKKMPSKQYHWTVFFACPICFRGLVAEVFDKATGRDPVSHHGDLRAVSEGFQMVVVGVWPTAQATTVPDHLPERVARALKEGCEVMAVSPAAACTQFRRALEFGLKDLAPEVEAWKLEKRIDKLAAEGKLTTALKDWAHQLRIDGNETVHGEEDPTREHAQAIEQLTRYVLTYLYTLPKSIELARAAESAA